MQFLLPQAAAVVGVPRSLGLLPGVFLLLAGEEALEALGAFLVARLGTSLLREVQAEEEGMEAGVGALQQFQ